MCRSYLLFNAHSGQPRVRQPDRLCRHCGTGAVSQAARLPGSTDGVSFHPQLKGEKGAPREWVFSNDWKGGRKKEGALDSARDHRYRLYSGGRMYDGEHQKARAKLDAAIKTVKRKP